MVAHGLRIFNYCLPDGNEEKREGGTEEEEKEEEAPLSSIFTSVYQPCIWWSEEKNPLCLKILWRRVWITYFPALQTWQKQFHPFVFPNAYSNLSWQLVDCGESWFLLRMLDFRTSIWRQQTRRLNQAWKHLKWHFIQTISEDSTLKPSRLLGHR